MHLLILLVKKWDGRNKLFKWLTNIISHFKERRTMKSNIFKVSIDWTAGIFFPFVITFLLCVGIEIYNILNGKVIFVFSNLSSYLKVTFLFFVYPTLASFGQHICVDTNAIWMRIAFVRCIRIPRDQIKECYIVNGIDTKRHLIGETLIIKSINDKINIYVSNRYTHQQRDEIAKLLGYENGIKSLKKKNIEKY